MLNEPQYLVPYAVSCVFRDPETGNTQSRLDLILAYNEGHAVGVAVNTYHMEGGTLPLFTAQSVPVAEGMARQTVAIFDEIAKLKQAASNKIVDGVFPRAMTGPFVSLAPEPEPEPEPSPSEKMRAIWKQPDPPKPDGAA